MQGGKRNFIDFLARILIKRVKPFQFEKFLPKKRIGRDPIFTFLQFDWRAHMKHDGLNNRQRLLLLFLGADEKSIDPVRIMKGIFIFGQESPSHWISEDDRYEFVPYNFGPCSFAIYDDLEKLDHFGYIRSEVIPGKSWRIYSITQEGIKESLEIRENFKPAVFDFLKKIRLFVTNLPFNSLLKAVYKAYPKFAEKSVFKE